MALVRCPECGREISSTANRCVNCGYRNCFSKKDKARIGIACLLQVVAIVLLITCCYVYTFEGHYYNYHKSEFGSEFDYSGYLVHSNDCFGNIFLEQNNSIDPEVNVTPSVSFFSYVVIGVGFWGIVVYLCMLLQEKYLKNNWLIPGMTVGALLIHSIVLSASTLVMVGTQGYYEVKPSVIWFLVVILEVLAAVLGKKSANKTTGRNMTKSQTVMNEAEACYVDTHGILHDNESDIAIQDIQT